MTEEHREITAAASSDLARGARWIADKARSYATRLVLGATAVVATAVWRKPDVFVALVAATFGAVALGVALVCLRLHRLARADVLELREEVRRLERVNLVGRRSHLMWQESLGHILLAWSGSKSSVRELERTLPHNNVVKSAVRDLQARGVLSGTSLKGVHTVIERASVEVSKVEHEIGPDRGEQEITLRITTRGDRRVTTAPSRETSPSPAPVQPSR